MPDLQDGETAEMQGSGSKPYVLKNTGGVYSCSCPAWRNQSVAIERRTCKHLRKLRGDGAEETRTGGAVPPRPARADGEEKAPPLLLAESWDGELWLGRKQFQRAVSIVRRQDQSDHWKQIKFLVFDAPALDAEFEERLRFLQDLVAKQSLVYVQAHG